MLTEILKEMERDGYVLPYTQREILRTLHEAMDRAYQAGRRSK